MNQYDELLAVFSDNYKEAILRLIESIRQNNNPVARAFLDELLSQISGVADPEELFIAVAESHICRGEMASVASDLVRVVDAGKFLRYYSMRFIELRGESRQQTIQSTLNFIMKTIEMTAENITFIFDHILELNGRLRRRGCPLWLTDVDSVSGCKSYQDYVERLTLGNVQPPLFCFTIPREQIQQCPNVRPDQPDFAPHNLMESRFPTVVDGMDYENFIEGGKTAGGASEYVSKLDNTEAIKKLGIVQ